MNFSVGDTISATCLTDAKPRPEVLWRINGKTIDDAEFRNFDITITETSENNTLDSEKVVSTFTWSRVTNYPFIKLSCQASNSAGLLVNTATAVFSSKGKHLDSCLAKHAPL